MTVLQTWLDVRSWIGAVVDAVSLLVLLGGISVALVVGAAGAGAL